MATTDPPTGVLVIGQIARDLVLRVKHWPPSSGSARVAERRVMLDGRATIRRSLRDISGRRCSCSASPGPTGRGRRRRGPRPAARGGRRGADGRHGDASDDRHRAGRSRGGPPRSPGRPRRRGRVRRALRPRRRSRGVAGGRAAGAAPSGSPIRPALATPSSRASPSACAGTSSRSRPRGGRVRRRRRPCGGWVGGPTCAPSARQTADPQPGPANRAPGRPSGGAAEEDVLPNGASRTAHARSRRRRRHGTVRSQGRRQASSTVAAAPCGPICSIPPSTTQEAPVT